MRGGFRRCVLIAGALLTLSAPTAWGQFSLVENFEDLTPGPIGGQAGWTAPDTGSTVALDPDRPDNQVLSVLTNSTILHRETTIPLDAVRMLFFRFRVESQLSCSLGLSDVVGPDRFDHFEVEFSVTNAPTELRINDDGTYDELSALETGIWYNCWVLVDNPADESQVWMHDRPGEPAMAADQLSAEGQTVFLFRNGGLRDLINFYIKTGGGNGVSGPLLLDDVYLETTSAVNLSNPSGIPPLPIEPATWGRLKAAY
jgi:hypothetical protein